MSYKIIGDSSLDFTDSLNKNLGVKRIPLTLMLGNDEYIDDETLDLPVFLEKMKTCREHIGSACPSPSLYQEAFDGNEDSFAITLSSALSGSYDSAVMGANLARENGDCGKIHVFDSKSASAGELLIALKIRELEKENLPFDEIVSIVEEYIGSLKTYFILESLDNLVKNGRLGKISGTIIAVTHVCPIMYGDDTGNIGFYSHAITTKQKISKLMTAIAKSCKRTEGERLVVTHCNNERLATAVGEAAKAQFRFGEVLIIPTGGLSSVYANEGGIIMSF